MKNEFSSMIDETRDLLKQNHEWEERYAGYAGRITGNLDFIKTI